MQFHVHPLIDTNREEILFQTECCRTAVSQSLISPHAYTSPANSSTAGTNEKSFTLCSSTSSGRYKAKSEQ